MSSRVKNLPIYKAGYSLMQIIAERAKNFPRNHRHTIGRKIQDEATELVLCIYKANAARDKIDHIERIQEQIMVVEMLSQLCFDLRIMPHDAYAKIIDITAGLGKQAGGWKKYAERGRV